MNTNTHEKRTKIFLDSGDPGDTTRALEVLGSFDGQTTNPSLVAKNPTVAVCLEKGEKCTEEMVLGFYKKIVEEIADLLPEGSISVEVHADKDSTMEGLLEQGREMSTWTKHAAVKLPITRAGLETAEALVREGVSVNMTLCFTQEQAAAVHRATMYRRDGAGVFISPFIGRLDDRGEDGISLVQNIVRMYEGCESHVEVLAASIRNTDHLFASIAAGSHIVTVPPGILIEWAEAGKDIPAEHTRDTASLKEIPYQELSCEADDWREYDITHPLTDTGLARFAEDWNKLVE